jgi:Leucine-rich repeat (LRR) protein
MQFLPPNNIIVQLGDTIQWTPLDPPTMPHTITSDNIPFGAAPFDQVWQMPADTFFQYIPQIPGLYQYVCTPHISFGMIGEFSVGFGPNSPKTYVPDDNFEQKLINLGYDNVLDDSVATASIDTVISLQVYQLNIADLTGIEDFTALEELYCFDNQITTLDLSSNTSLTHLNCDNNQMYILDVSQNTSLSYLSAEDNNLINLDVSQNSILTYLNIESSDLTTLDLSNNNILIELDCENNDLLTLDLSNNTNLEVLDCNNNQLTNLDLNQNTGLIFLDCAYNQLSNLNVSNSIDLIEIHCENNQLTSLDVSNNDSLFGLDCEENQLTALDVSNNTALVYFFCSMNQLISLDLRNGNNNNMLWWDSGSSVPGISASNNPYLNCINVDDSIYCNANWLSDIDPQQYYSNNCLPSAIQEHTNNKELLKVTDLLGRETKQTNQPLFYIYNDGTIEKKIIIE